MLFFVTHAHIHRYHHCILQYWCVVTMFVVLLHLHWYVCDALHTYVWHIQHDVKADIQHVLRYVTNTVCGQLWPAQMPQWSTVYKQFVRVNYVSEHYFSLDPTILFNRLLVIVQRSPDIQKYFSYELPAHPASLFRDMRKTNKSQLAKELQKFSQSSQIPPLLLKHVVDGGYLLRVVCWNTGASHGDTAQQYVAYVDRHFGESSIIVFDGYCDGPSIKDHKHQRRAKRYAPDVVVDPVRTAWIPWGLLIMTSQAFWAMTETKVGLWLC